MDINEIKKIELLILKEVDRICKKNNIKYTLFAGTLIGAVRHKGFIPWDDDIDIAMTRENYNKFLACFEKEKGKDYDLINTSKYSDYYCSFAKISYNKTRMHEVHNVKLDYLGIFIDIFPLDKISNIKYNKRIMISILLSKPLYMLGYNKEYYKKNKPLFKRILRTIFSILPNKFYSDIINKNAQKDNNIECDKIGSLVGGQGEKDIWPINIFDEYTYLDFEGEKFMAIKDYDIMLKHRYGDYMKLPPKEEQVGHHYIEAYYMDTRKENKI